VVVTGGSRFTSLKRPVCPTPYVLLDAKSILLKIESLSFADLDKSAHGPEGGRRSAAPWAGGYRASMAETSFLVVGEAVVDLIGEAGTWRFEAAPGGSPLNVAVGLAAAGHPVRLAAERGDDLFGRLIQEHLDRYGVDTTDLAVTADPTNLAVARLDPAGVASYDLRLGWRWRGPARLAGVGCLHTGSLAATLAPGADAVAEAVAAARRRGVTVSYDPNVRPSLMGDRTAATARVERLVAAADIVKASRDDLAWLYPGTPDLAAARRWARSGPWLVVVTRGADGAVALHRGRVLACPAPPVRVVDTVGAGDAFTAGLLSRLAAALPGPSDRDRADRDPPNGGAPDRSGPDRGVPGPVVAEALRHATATAAAACTARGAVPPPPEAVAALRPATRVHQRAPAGDA
jgi:fructokinase